jgi:hypothetical protein
VAKITKVKQKFEVGQRVKLLAYDYYSGLDAGSVGYITGVGEKFLRVFFPEHPSPIRVRKDFPMCLNEVKAIGGKRRYFKTFSGEEYTYLNFSFAG